jgi:hypothetical protein
MEVNGEKLQKITNFIIAKRGNDLALFMKATTSHLCMLDEEGDCFRKAQSTGAAQGRIHGREPSRLSP